MSKPLNILLVASEVVPFAKTGGLADVAGALPKALAKLGHHVRVVLPRYGSIDKNHWNLRPVGGPLGVDLGSAGEKWCAVYEGMLPGSEVRVYCIEHEQFYGRSGIYNQENGEGYADNDSRFIFLSKAALVLCKMLHYRPDIIHVNDWQTAAIPVLLNTTYRHDPLLGGVKTVLTIHNMQHQGNFGWEAVNLLGRGWNRAYNLGLNKDGRLNLLHGGILHATQLNSVSEGYAREIKTPEFGYGLDGLIRYRQADLVGILNGADYDVWNPETDSHIAQNYSASDLSGKSSCKRDLQRLFKLPERPEVPLIGVVGRLAKQKGIDIIAAALHDLVGWDIQFVLLGKGESWAHFFFGDMAAKHPTKFGCRIAHDDVLAHKIEAGADFFLMPSSFEPCGLNQIYSLRYGTLPIVRATGGLQDTIENFDEKSGRGTGFKFNDHSPVALKNTLGWAVHTYYNRKDALNTLIASAMAKRFSWEMAAQKYEQLYSRALA
jgi:starch synthase